MHPRYPPPPTHAEYFSSPFRHSSILLTSLLPQNAQVAVDVGSCLY